MNKVLGRTAVLAFLVSQPTHAETVLDHYLALHEEFRGYYPSPDLLLRLDLDVDGDGSEELFLSWSKSRTGDSDRFWAVYAAHADRSCFLGWLQKSGNHVLPATGGRNANLIHWNEYLAEQPREPSATVELDVSQGEILSRSAPEQPSSRQLPPEAVPIRPRRASIEELRADLGGTDRGKWVPNFSAGETYLSVTASSGSPSAEGEAPIVRCSTAKALGQRNESIAEHFRRVQLDPGNSLEPALLERLNIDLDGNGREETFLTERGESHRYGIAGRLWQVYSLDGLDVCWSGSLIMEPTFSRYDRVRAALVTVATGNGDPVQERLYRLVGGQVTREVVHWTGPHESRAEVRASQLAQIEAELRKPGAPKLLTAPARSLIRGGAVGDEVWKDAEGRVVSLAAKVGATSTPGPSGPFSAILPCRSADAAVELTRR